MYDVVIVETQNGFYIEITLKDEEPFISKEAAEDFAYDLEDHMDIDGFYERTETNFFGFKAEKADV